MKLIEIKDQLRHRIALELSDCQMAEADQKYGTVKGKLKNAFIDAESALGHVAQLLFRRLGTVGDCPVYFRGVKDRRIAEKGECALWDRFAENCQEMEVI